MLDLQVRTTASLFRHAGWQRRVSRPRFRKKGHTIRGEGAPPLMRELAAFQGPCVPLSVGCPASSFERSRYLKFSNFDLAATPIQAVASAPGLVFRRGPARWTLSLCRSAHSIHPETQDPNKPACEKLAIGQLRRLGGIGGSFC